MSFLICSNIFHRRAMAVSILLFALLVFIKIINVMSYGGFSLQDKRASDIALVTSK